MRGRTSAEHAIYSKQQEQKSVKGIKCDISVRGMGDGCCGRKDFRNNPGHVPTAVFLQSSTSDDMGRKN